MRLLLRTWNASQWSYQSNRTAVYITLRLLLKAACLLWTIIFSVIVLSGKRSVTCITGAYNLCVPRLLYTRFHLGRFSRFSTNSSMTMALTDRHTSLSTVGHSQQNVHQGLCAEMGNDKGKKCWSTGSFLGFTYVSVFSVSSNIQHVISEERGHSFEVSKKLFSFHFLLGSFLWSATVFSCQSFPVILTVFSCQSFPVILTVFSCQSFPVILTVFSCQSFPVILTVFSCQSFPVILTVFSCQSFPVILTVFSCQSFPVILTVFSCQSFPVILSS